MKSKSLFLLLASMLALTGCAGAGESPEGGGTTPEEQHEKESEIVLVSISVKTQPTKKEYKEGETFDPTGMVVEATYSDGTTKEVTNYQISNQALTVSTTSINILYEGKTAQVDITVNPLPTYVVTFMASESEKIEDVTYKEGATPSYSYSVPSTAQYEYEFLGWSLTPNGDVLSELPKVTQNATYYAKIQQKTRKYSIIFKNEAGSVLQNSEVEYGTKPVAPEYNPTDTAQYDYSFVGWATSQGGEVLASLPEVTGAATYFAVVSSTVRSYTIKFIDEDGDEIQSNTLEYGATPTCDYEVEDTAEWDYTTKWSKTAGGSAIASFPTVTGNATYYAIVTKVKQKYDITFKNEDGSAYKTVNVEYGSIPSVTSPTKAADQQYTYAFAGWSTTKGGEALTSLPAVNGEATYYAIFGKTVNQYSIKLHLNTGDTDVFETITSDYGTQFSDFDEVLPDRKDQIFEGWYKDSGLTEKLSFPFTLTGNCEFYANWIFKEDITGLFEDLLGIIDSSPKSFLPDSMKPEFEDNLISKDDILDFNETQNVSDMMRIGYGEQWELVLRSIEQAELFSPVLKYGDNAITGITSLVINHFKKSSSDTKQENELLTVNASFKGGVLTSEYIFNKGIELPLFGEVKPYVMLYFDSVHDIKEMKIKINENNKIYVAYNDDNYEIAYKYGFEDGYKLGAFELSDNGDYTLGQVFEYYVVKDVKVYSLVSLFKIEGDYVSVVGNRASGLIGFAGYINELYDIETGHLLGYKVQEHLNDDIPLIGGKTYYTFFFNLWDIDAITNVKAIKNDETSQNKNHHDVYLNEQSNIFKVKRNGIASRKYDCEMRTRYAFGLDENGKLIKYEFEVPMMFIQDDTIIDTDSDSYTNFSDFPNDMKKTSDIDGAKVNDGMSDIIGKLRADHKELIPTYNQMNTISVEIIERGLSTF